MADYLTTDTELTSIANAIRSKGGTSASLSYPTGFVDAIAAIPTGGGGGGGTTTVTLPDTVNATYCYYVDGGGDVVDAGSTKTFSCLSGSLIVAICSSVPEPSSDPPVYTNCSLKATISNGSRATYKTTYIIQAD